MGSVIHVHEWLNGVYKYLLRKNNKFDAGFIIYVIYSCMYQR